MAKVFYQLLTVAAPNEITNKQQNHTKASHSVQNAYTGGRGIEFASGNTAEMVGKGIRGAGVIASLWKKVRTPHRKKARKKNKLQYVGSVGAFFLAGTESKSMSSP